jgi:hypothetical protein
VNRRRWLFSAARNKEGAMRLSPISTAIGCVAALLMAGIAAAGPGDRVQRYALVVCTDCRSDDMYPAVATDAAGNSIVVWVKYDATDFPDFGLWARWFGPDGYPRGDQFRIFLPPTSFEGAPGAPSVAMSPDGAFVVTWTWTDTVGRPAFVRARVFGNDGAPRSGVITVSSADNTGSLPSVAMDDDGDFIVVWASGDRTSENSIVWARMYDSVGTPKGPAFSVDPTGPSPRRRIPDVAMDASGNFVVVWWQFHVANQTMAVFGRRYGAAGIPSGDRFPVSTTGVAGDAGVPAVAMADTGSFAVAFDRSLTDSNSETVSLGIFGRRFDASGAPLGGEFRASAVGRGVWNGHGAHDVDIDMDNDGDFVVVWIGSDGNDYPKLHVRLYAAAGTPLSPDRSYGFGGLYGVEPPGGKVAMDAVGNFVATWFHYSGTHNTGYDRNVFVQHFAGPDDTRPGCSSFIAGIVGTVGNDSLQGTSSDDVIHGLGGNDLLKGGGGADIICGGFGDDQIFGESGRDHLLGGPGDDVLDGGDGKDLCNGNRQTNADTALGCEAVLQVP